jgi:hypothetical protein
VCATQSFADAMATLSESDRALVLRSIRVLADACAPFDRVTQATQFPSQLRVRSVAQTDAIYEMRWTLQRSDARLTWQVRSDAQGPFLLLRCLGGVMPGRAPRRARSAAPSEQAVLGR